MRTRHATHRNFWVLGIAGIVLAAGFTLPAAADEMPVAHMRRSCKKLDKQIAHYKGVAEMAEDRRDYRWWDSTRAHVKRLEARRPRICPEQVAEEKRQWVRRGAKAARDAVKLASSMAIRYFTAGATGGSSPLPF
jgi:hypothetical protein